MTPRVYSVFLHGLSLALCALLACASMGVDQDGRPLGQARAIATAATAAADAQQDSATIPVGDSPVLGPSNALATLVVFSDFQCPHCERLARTMAVVHERYETDVRIVFKHLPLSRHRNAQLAAEASMAAHAQGRFWQYHDLLFAQQDALAHDDLVRYAEQAGLDVERFRADLDGHRFRERVAQDVALARRLQIDSTPSTYVNGTVVRGAKRFAHFVRVVDRVLAHARTLTPAEQVYAQMTAQPLESEPEDRPTPPEPTFDLDAVHAIPVDNAPFRGPLDAPVTLSVFSDFECSYCARFVPTLEQLLRAHPQDIRLQFRHAPGARHPHALDAAAFAEEARAQGGDAGFYRAHDLLFAHRDALTREDLMRYGAELRLDAARLTSAFAQNSHQAAIDRDVAIARRFDVDGTPTIFINGRRVLGARPLEELEQSVQRAMAEAQALIAQGAPRAEVYSRVTARGAAQAVYERAPEEIHAAHFLVMHTGSQRAPAGITRTREEALVRTQEALRALRAGATFEAIVTQYSDEPGAGERAGDLGTFRHGAMVPAFDAAAFRLRVGETSGIVETPFGFHVIRRLP
ncbi:MAG: thioredoxin domain-containing protein [Deltaproteobacteria bacterium]|nr:thioredoxin domain-containing protein [Deltaproteobacteria bacterium]